VHELTSAPLANDSLTVITASELNKKKSSYSNDLHYSSTPLKYTSTCPTATFTEYSTFTILDNLHATATGSDQLPAWFLRIGAPFFASSISHIFSLSLL